MRRIICLILVLAVCFCCLTSCGEGEYSDETFFGMDTFVTIKTDRQGDEASAIYENCKKVLEALDGGFSRHIEGSTTYKYNNGEDKVNVSTDYKELLDIAEEVRRETDGAFTVTAGALTELWEKCELRGSHPTEEELQTALKSVESEVKLNGYVLSQTDAVLEFGGIAKGYACDKLVEAMKQGGSKSGMVSFTSTIGVFGISPSGNKWKIAIKDPLDTNKVLGYVSLSDAFLSVSGDYERFYEIGDEKYTHILDTETGMPVNNGVHSVAVVAKSGALSDALSTALFVMGPEKAQQLYGNSDEVAFLFVTDDGIVSNFAMNKIYK